ncbi:MAG: cytochrome P450, partial [Alphaproteobacteria bacterium]|nr:cytochrome P450 [Alphaproteobacteria bacterium]
MGANPPVNDWSSDYDIFDEDYVRDPGPVWEELRTKCPIAHTERWGGSWMPTKYADLQAFARMVPVLSSKNVLVVSQKREEIEFDPVLAEYGAAVPPITSDPPEHVPMRRLLLPLFTPKATEAHRPFTEALCHKLIDRFIDNGACDAALDYAVHIPAKTIAHVIGVDEERTDEFVGWIRGVLEEGNTNLEK